jgi:hypothetical protein
MFAPFFNVQSYRHGRPNVRRHWALNYEWWNRRSSVRTEEGVVTQLLICHTRLVRGHLLIGDPAPFCDQCGVHLTALHILLECSRHDPERQTFRRHGELWDFLGDDLRKGASTLLVLVLVLARLVLVGRLVWLLLVLVTLRPHYFSCSPGFGAWGSVYLLVVCIGCSTSTSNVDGP